jgi:prevent-host-death family protein
VNEPRPGSSADAARIRTIADAKAHFAECVREVEAGRSIVLTRHGRAVARLVPIGEGGEVQDRGPSVRGSVRLPEEVAEPTATYPTAPVARREALQSFFRDQIWPRVPEELLGRGISKREREEILGYDSRTGTSETKTPVRERRR